MCNVIGPFFHLGRPHIWPQDNDGLLASQGLRISEHRVDQSLSRTNPAYHHARRTATDRQVNLTPYQANYFGHKLHIDQNEKRVMYGVTRVCCGWVLQQNSKFHKSNCASVRFMGPTQSGPSKRVEFWCCSYKSNYHIYAEMLQDLYIYRAHPSRYVLFF